MFKRTIVRIEFWLCSYEKTDVEMLLEYEIDYFKVHLEKQNIIKE